MVYFKKLFIKAHVKTNVQKLLSVIVAIKKELSSPTASDWACDILFQKITKIVSALWLAERSVCMRVCKDGRGVKMFCFSRANHASVNLKKFSSSKLDKFTLFTHSSVGWNFENRYKEGVSIFFSFKLTVCMASFCKTRTDYSCKASCTRLCDWEEFLF